MCGGAPESSLDQRSPWNCPKLMGMAMRCMMRQIAIGLLLLFSWAAQVYPDITLTSGYWSTAFNCTDWSQPNALSCDGINMTDASAYCNGSSASAINSSYNYSGGAGGSGYRVYFEGNVHNGMSSPVRITFTTPQKAFWVRFYYHIPSGQALTNIVEHKIIYAYTDGGVYANANWPMGFDTTGLQPRYTMGSPDIYYNGGVGHNGHGDSTYGSWDAVYGVSSAADGSWHCFEFQFDLGTSGSNNGIYRMWVDGVNVVNDTDLDWFNGGSASPTGWSYFDIPHNHNMFTLDTCSEHYIDDVAVAVSSYTGFVQNKTGFATNLDMIGPIGYGGSDTTDPVVTTTDPVDDPHDNESTPSITIQGTCTDNVACTSVTCTNDNGSCGPNTKTSSAWSFDVTLGSGINHVTITGYDAAGNSAEDTVAVTYTQVPDQNGPSDDAGSESNSGGGCFIFASRF